MSEPITRKDFLKGMFGFLRNAAVKEQKNTIDKLDNYLLPPGSAQLEEFLQTCRQSYKCVSVCPYEAIEVYRENAEDALYGYPVINPQRQACHWCEDFPCITACESGALNIERKDWPLGTAVILEDFCFSYRGVFCAACVVKCPLSGAAITMVDNKPVINEQKCTGCGLCVQACPTEQRAIWIKAAN